MRNKRGENRLVGRPVRDDLVQREFAADRPDRLRLTDITEHPTGEGKLYLCAMKDVFSNRLTASSDTRSLTG